MAHWFGNLFDNYPLHCPESTWLMEEIIATKYTSFRPLQVTGVYQCKQIEPETGKEAIAKLHMQGFRVPSNPGLSPEKLAGEASTAVNILAKTEVEVLSHLTRSYCQSTPRLLYYSQAQQTEEMCLPGGYIVLLLMKKLPGKVLSNFWDCYDLETRHRIRDAFKVAWMEMSNACVHQNDTALRNILWDEVSGKCYLIDFEDAEFSDEPDGWSIYEFFFWDLMKHTDDEERKTIL